MYGDCAADLEAARQEGFDPDNHTAPQLSNCTTLVQMPSPEVNAPPGLDMAKIGEAYLQLLGMTPDEARQFASTVDWTSTFVIPVPRTGTTSQTVSVDGVDGSFIQQRLENNGRQYLLIWVKDGLIYALTGPGKLQDALSVASAIQ
jgi:ATP adenylyltransferase/5',5'''-P-1,P-4-tetraphosphate phosphorylase II